MSEKPFAVEVPEEVATQVAKATRDMQVKVARYAAEQQDAFLAEIRPKLKEIKGFWTMALLNHPIVGGAATASDREALKALTDVELIRDTKDPRAYELVFHFEDNDYFTNKTLSKKYNLPEGVAAAPADGSITDEIRDFDPASLVSPATEIKWKEGKDLVKLHPRKMPNVEDLEDVDVTEIEGDVGSFFHYFTTEGDMFEVGEAILEDVLQDPYKWFEGEEEISDEDDELDDEDEDDEDDDKSVDLEEDEEEQPAKKKQKK